MHQRQTLAQALACVPSHRQPPQTVAHMARKLAQQTHTSVATATTEIKTALALLDAFAALTWVKNSVHTKDQLHSYFANSVRLSLVENGEIFLDSSLLEHIETQRRAHNPAATPSRFQKAAFVLIGNKVGKALCFLHQFDENAQQFQLIGGRVEPDDANELAAALRELNEELGISQPAFFDASEITLTPLLEPPFEIAGISHTYGALTQYCFYAFHAHIQRSNIVLGKNDRWLSIHEMLQGHTRDGLSLGDTRIAEQINTRIAGGLRGLPVSLRTP